MFSPVFFNPLPLPLTTYQPSTSLLIPTTCQNIEFEKNIHSLNNTDHKQPREAVPSRACSLSKMRGPDPPSRGACRRRRNMPPGWARRMPLGFLNRSSRGEARRGELLVPNKLVGQVKGGSLEGLLLIAKSQNFCVPIKIVFVVSRPSCGWRI